MLTGQIQVIRFCWHVFGLAGIEPGWELRKGKPWMLTVSEMNAIDRVEADFRGVVQLAVNELEGAGVGLVPSWTGDHVVVGELLLLDIEWDLPARELAEALQPPAIGAIHIDASGTIHRRGSGERANNNIGALRRAYERHRYGPPPRAPTPDGGTRALPEPTRLRRQALAKVRERWPGVTASQIFTTFGDHGVQRGGQARTPGGYLRQLLEEDAGPGESWTAHPRAPSTTISGHSGPPRETRNRPAESSGRIQPNDPFSILSLVSPASGPGPRPPATPRTARGPGSMPQKTGTGSHQPAAVTPGGSPPPAAEAAS